MKFTLNIGVLLFGILSIFAISCNKDNINPNIPDAPINIDIDPNSTLIQELNTVGGWVYLDEKPGIFIPNTSRGVMVYRMDINIFKAYERQPPNTPNQCCTNGICTKLIIGDNFPFAKDTCTNTLYQLMDGTLFAGEGRYSLIEYAAVYDGNRLRIYN